MQTWSFVLRIKFSAELIVLCSETRPNAKPENDYRYFDQTGVEDCASLDLKDDEALLTDEERFEREKRRMTKAFRIAYPRDAQANDDLHGEGNWWAEGSAKHGFELYFAN